MLITMKYLLRLFKMAANRAKFSKLEQRYLIKSFLAENFKPDDPNFV